ncbi:hypothetical protein FBQ85_28985, partial [Cytophagia bacterium CHB2]|nr:hypothetical protein [Cytophagia bacterium CHB2]
MRASTMITELRIEGFKSFGTPEQVLPLGHLNFIVGANASGKTNLISALRFLQNAVSQNAEFAVNDLGGIAEVRNKIMREREQAKPVKLGLKMSFLDDVIRFKSGKDNELRFQSFSYTLTLDLRNPSGLPEVVSENLIAEIQDEKGEKHKYQLKRDESLVQILDPTDTQGTLPHKIKVPKEESTRLALGVGFFSPPCVILRHII